MSRNLNIIIIDDEMEALVHFLYQIIDEKELTYKFFNDNPLDALDYVKDHLVDCAYIDIRMPQVDGITLATKLLEIKPSLKIVFITAFSFEEQKIKEMFGDSLLGFVYKPFDPNELRKTLVLLQQDETRIQFSTFGCFDLKVNGISVHFLSKKSKELLALLLVEGKELTMEDIILHLWPNREIDLAKRLYRDSVYKLRNKLKELGISELIKVHRGSIQLNVDYPNIECDLWNYLNQKESLYTGEFLNTYEWARAKKQMLDKKGKIKYEKI